MSDDFPLEVLSTELTFYCLEQDCKYEQTFTVPDPELPEMFPAFERTTVVLDDESYEAVRLRCPDCGSGEFYPMQDRFSDTVLVQQLGVCPGPERSQ